MNKEWSELNKQMQSQIGRECSYKDGLKTLLHLRAILMDTLLSFRNDLSSVDFSAIPYINAEGYHSKTIAYSIWHIFRIEDIVAHSLINNDEQIFCTGNYQKRINSPIITTGNELQKQAVADFSKELVLDELYSYALEVKNSTEQILFELQYADLKRKIPPDRKEYLRSMNVVSADESAAWLIDYWCGKDIRGLIKMPFSRHWIMHIEACLRIISRLNC
ncbi:MAG: phage head-tail adapter protein [Oscillospiraceae bacterium]|nr:phage head-tail adapter protein [Oscillospiraceae bacterium]